jgi:hypothetical protein
MTAKHTTVLTTAETGVWRKLLTDSWTQMQAIFPRLREFEAPRKRYWVRDETKRRTPNRPRLTSDN